MELGYTTGLGWIVILLFIFPGLVTKPGVKAASGSSLVTVSLPSVPGVTLR